MKYRKVGNTGLKISEISYGSWLTTGGTLDDEIAMKCLSTALESGINFIDSADVYARGEAEKVIGEFLKEETYRRRDLVISSKVFWPMSDDVNDSGLSRKHIMESIDASLERLNLDYVDINPIGPTIALLAGCSHKSAAVQRWGIRAFENWCNIDSLNYLKEVECNEAWIQLYLEKVISDLEEIYVVSR